MIDKSLYWIVKSASRSDEAVFRVNSADRFSEVAVRLVHR